MSSTKQPVNEGECNFSSLKPIEPFKYPSQASKIISEVNSNNILTSSAEIIDLIKTNKISINMAIYLISAFSEIREKDINLFSEFYQKISNEFSCVIKPNNIKLATLLHYKGFNFEKFKPKMTEEAILNLYSKESPLYYIAWDLVDDLKSKFPNLKINTKVDDEIKPLDCAIKYGSELCFNYMKNLGAKYTKHSEEYAVKGGNKNIFMQMVEEGESFNKMINTALGYQHYEIAEYLKSNFGQNPDSIRECMYFGNFKVISYLLSNGADINKPYYIFFLFIFTIGL
ncbi:spectrin binding [Trichomonas vaginalis G3]|uniref:spectrin binding n=1 Tax=Trichomonas vaginalis (strain ATCC PRA-98 / G3) TaxID=412133 RepID=UPI0021E5A9A7|nr:spectrin binding [Trichomonas vaginalis G3]KAI5503252.1 spectrin binding [Trichomonas vaginalis G3]